MMIGVTGLTNMLPSSSFNNIVDGAIRNTVFFSKLYEHTVSMNILSPDFLYLFSSKNSTISTLTARVAAFLYGILAILFASSKKQVIRTDTWGIVTTMAYLQIIRNWAIGKFIGYTMDEAASANIAYQSISTLSCGTCPSPTAIGVSTVGSMPETAFKIALAWGILMGHLHNLLYRLVGVRLGTVPESPTTPHYTTSARFPSISGFMGVCL